MDPVDASVRVDVVAGGNATTTQALTIRWTGSGGGTGTGQTSLGGTITLTLPDAGGFTLSIEDLPDHCFADADEISVSVSDGTPASASFDVTCVGGYAHRYNTSVFAYRGLDGSTVEHDFGGQVFLFDWESTGRFLLFRRNTVPGCPLIVFDEQTGDVTEVANSADGYAGPEPVWSPDATRFAVLRTGDCSTNGVGDAVLLIDPLTGLTVDSIVGLGSAPGLTWGPGASQVTYTSGSEIRIHDWDTGADSLFATMLEDPQTVAWSPDMQLLAATIGSGADIFLRLYQPGGDEVAEFGGPGSRFSRLRWAPDATRLAFSTNGGGAFTVVDRMAIEVFSEAGGGGFAASPHWAPDSGSLLFTGNDGGPNYIGWVAADGTGLTALTDDTSDDDEPRWAGGNEAFIYHGGGGSALLLGQVAGTLRVSVSALTRSSFPRWNPAAPLDLD